MTPEQVMEKAWDLIVAEVRRLNGQEKVTYENIGKRLGVSKVTVQRWDKAGIGGEDTSFVSVLRYLKGLSIPLGDVLPAARPLPEIAGERVEDQELAAKGLTVLGVYAVAGAGPAWEEETAEPVLNIAVPARFLNPHIGALLISGKSMEPTILNNAIVGVNRSKISITQGDIYAVRLPYEGIVVKRVYLDHENQCFVLRSDNKKDEREFPDITIPFDAGDSFVYGKVSWVMQSYER